MAPRPPKGTPTDSNLHSLARLFGDAQEVSNQVPPTQIASLKRCLAAGLVEIGPSRKTIRLTPAGIEAVQKEREDHARRMGPSVVPSVELARALGVRPNEPITEKALAAKIEAHTQPVAPAKPDAELIARRAWLVRSVAMVQPGSNAHRAELGGLADFDRQHPEVVAFEKVPPTEAGGYRVGMRVVHPRMGFGTVAGILPEEPGVHWKRLVIDFDLPAGKQNRHTFHPDHVNHAPANEATWDRAGLLKEWWRLQNASMAALRSGYRERHHHKEEELRAFERLHPEIREAGLQEMSDKEEADMGNKLRSAARKGLL